MINKILNLLLCSSDPRYPNIILLSENGCPMFRLVSILRPPVESKRPLD